MATLRQLVQTAAEPRAFDFDIGSAENDIWRPGGACHHLAIFKRFWTKDSLFSTSGSLVYSFLFKSGVLQVDRFTSDLNNPTGRLTPGGPSAGNTLIIGDYIQGSDATLALDIGGSAPGIDFDQLEIPGPAAMDGLLELRLDRWFHPDCYGRIHRNVCG